MCNISNFAQTSSVLVQRSTAPTRLLSSRRPCKQNAVIKMDTSAGRRASAHGP